MNNDFRRGLAGLSCCVLLVAAGAVLLGSGPLNPPAGAVAGTAKPLSEVEPRVAINAANTPGDADSVFKITQPGSYYLTGNISGVAGKHGIEIVASGVTLDLNGFDLVGLPGMGAFDGVSVTVDGLRGITVKNGSVRNWGDGGVDLGFLSSGCRVAGVLASGNAGNGINAGIACTVADCTASFNTLGGIRTNNGSTITHCSVYSNTGSGIQVNQGCTIANCSAYLNSASGLLTGSGCTVVDCSAYQNTGHGLQLGEGGTATRCSTLSNTGRGISAGDACTVADCTANFNSEGIRGTTGVVFSGCAARSNTSFGIVAGNHAVIRGCTSVSNGTTGIFTASGAAVLHCSVSLNTINGITVLAGCTVADCTSSLNTLNGIVCNSDCVIRGNTCHFNGLDAGDGAGIYVNGTKSRVESNDCSMADRGIEVGLAGNIIIKNTCSGNTTDWVIAANNVIGPILDRRNPANAAVNGFSSATSLNTLDPHANFSH